MNTDFQWMDAVAQAALVRAGEVTPAELVAAARDRIDEFNPALNAIVTPIDHDIPEMGPLAGVPFLVKDLAIEIAGTPFSEGSRWVAGTVSTHDQELAVRYRRAGLAVLGKTNTPEFGLSPTCEPLLHGPTRNPWDLDRSPGGSSGGSAAAVAAGLVPMAHGNDLGGSLRYPAAWCGVFALKPTRGRVPIGPEYGDVVSGLAVEHALTRSVRDSAVLLDAASGPAPGDPYWAPSPMRPFKDEVGADTGRLRIAYSSTPSGGQVVHPDYVQALNETVELLVELGHEVVEARPPALDGAGQEAVGHVYRAAVSWIVGYWTRRLGRGPQADELEPQTWAYLADASMVSGGHYLLAIEELQRASRRIADWFQQNDAWLTPTVGGPAELIGALVGTTDDPLRGAQASGRFLMFDGELANITGNPAMSLPLCVDTSGLPIGMSFLGRFGDEATLFRLAGQLEQARPWAQRRPATLEPIATAAGQAHTQVEGST